MSTTTDQSNTKLQLHVEHETQMLMLYNLILTSNFTFSSPTSPFKLVMHVKSDHLTRRTRQEQHFNSNYTKAYFKIELQTQSHKYVCTSTTVALQLQPHKRILTNTSSTSHPPCSQTLKSAAEPEVGWFTTPQPG